MTKKFIVMVFLIALLAGSFAITDALCGYYEKVIDIMVIGDEEFQFEFPHGWERYLGWGIYFELYTALNPFGYKDGQPYFWHSKRWTRPCLGSNPHGPATIL